MNWQGQIEHLVAIGQVLICDNTIIKDEYLIKKCQSVMWVKIDVLDGRIYVKAFSKSLIVNGLICEIKRIFDGSTPSQLQEKLHRFNLLNYSRLLDNSVGVNELINLIMEKASGS